MSARIFECSQCFTQDQVFAGELFVLRLPQLRSRSELLPDHLGLSFPVPVIEHVSQSESFHPLQVEARQIAASGQRFGERCLAAAARPLDQKRLAAAERVRKVYEQAALDEVARAGEYFGQRITPLTLEQAARVYARSCTVIRLHYLPPGSLSTISAICRSSGLIRGIAA